MKYEMDRHTDILHKTNSQYFLTMSDADNIKNKKVSY